MEKLYIFSHQISSKILIILGILTEYFINFYVVKCYGFLTDASICYFIDEISSSSNTISNAFCMELFIKIEKKSVKKKVVENQTN